MRVWLDDKLPDAYIDMVIRCLRVLGDITLQRKLWLNQPGTDEDVDTSCYAEAVCSLYDDSGLGDCLSKYSTGLSLETESSLRELSDAIDRIRVDDEYSEQFLSSPEMDVVRRIAQVALKLFVAEVSGRPRQS